MESEEIYQAAHATMGEISQFEEQMHEAKGFWITSASILPLIVEDEHGMVVEVTVVDSISGGAQEEKGMPKHPLYESMSLIVFYLIKPFGFKFNLIYNRLKYVFFLFVYLVSVVVTT